MEIKQLNEVLKKEIETKLIEIKAKYEKELIHMRKDMSDNYELELNILT